MISKKSGPPRPPLPERMKKAENTSQQQDEAQKSLGHFSIRFSRDDANESDEEISIVRKDKSPDGQSESASEGKSENLQNAESSDDATSPKSILSSLSLPFIAKSPTLNNGSEALSSEEQPQQDSVGEIVFKTSHFDEDSETSPSTSNEVYDSNGHLSTSPLVPKRRDNPVVQSAMTLKSLLIKERRNGHEEKSHVGLKTKGFLASALVDSSRVVVPIGLGDLNSEVGTPVKQQEPVACTEIPLYNMLFVSMFVFLYFMLPSSSFVNGFMFGGILTLFLVFALMWLLTPEMTDEEKYKRDVMEHEREMKMLEKTSPAKFLQPWQLCQQPDLEVRLANI